MTLPNLYICENESYINMLDTDTNEYTDVIQLDTIEDTTYLFFRLLDIMLEYYEKGYENGAMDMI